MGRQEFHGDLLMACFSVAMGQGLGRNQIFVAVLRLYFSGRVTFYWGFVFVTSICTPLAVGFGVIIAKNRSNFVSL